MSCGPVPHLMPGVREISDIYELQACSPPCPIFCFIGKDVPHQPILHSDTGGELHRRSLECSSAGEKEARPLPLATSQGPAYSELDLSDSVAH